MDSAPAVMHPFVFDDTLNEWMRISGRKQPLRRWIVLFKCGVKGTI